MRTQAGEFASHCLISALVVGLMVACCSCTSGPSAEASAYTVADATGDWGYPSPYTHYSRGPGYVRMHYIFETLVWKDASEFVPQLAEEWNYSEEENAYTFELRDDVVWHDGTEFTAADVAFTFRYTKEHPYQWVDNTIVESVEALDDDTVKLYLSRPYAPFMQDVGGAQPIIPKHIWEGVDEPREFTGAEAVIGTGPYILADYSKEHGSYLYKALPGYYMGTPRVEKLKFAKISEEMIPAALKEGSVNAGEVPPEVVASIEEAGITVISAPLAWNCKMMMNHREEPLSSREFRQAVAYAIDRESLVQVTQRGHAVAGSPGLIPPTSDWYNPDTPQYEYDPDKARALLEQLGYSPSLPYYTRDGQMLELSLLATADFKEVGQFIEQELEAVGIKVAFRTMEAKTVDARVEAWDFDLSIYGHGGLYEPAILNRVIIGKGFNSARYHANEELEQLVEGQLNEMDPGRRREMVLEIQELYANELPALTLYYPKWYWAHDGSIDLFYTEDGMAIGIPLPLNRMAFVR